MAPILVVDDEPDMVQLVRFNLETAGFAVEAASNGFEAIRIARRRALSAIVLDVMMPQIDGFEVCRLLRRHPRTKTTPILLMTALNSKLACYASAEVGANFYIVKPFSHSDLVSRLKSLLT